MKAVNIKWDVDFEEDLEMLPTEIEIPDSITKDAFETFEDFIDAIDDYISNVTDFCHNGYELKE